MGRAEIGRENAEIERRQLEAARDWRRLPAARREFAADEGRVAHQDWQATLRRREARRGRVEGADYGIEYELAHPDGGKVRYDYVDLRAHRIVDLKPAVEGDTVAGVAAAHAHQRQRHLDAYKAKFGVEAEYHYAFHPSTRSLFGPEKSTATSRDGARISDAPAGLTPEQKSARMQRNVLHPKKEVAGQRPDAAEPKPGQERDARRAGRRPKS